MRSSVTRIFSVNTLPKTLTLRLSLFGSSLVSPFIFSNQNFVGTSLVSTCTTYLVFISGGNNFPYLLYFNKKLDQQYTLYIVIFLFTEIHGKYVS